MLGQQRILVEPGAPVAVHIDHGDAHRAAEILADGLQRLGQFFPRGNNLRIGRRGGRGRGSGSSYGFRLRIADFLTPFHAKGRLRIIRGSAGGQGYGGR